MCQGCTDSLRNSGAVDATEGLQLLDAAMLYKLVGQAEAGHLRVVAVVGEPLQHSTSHASLTNPIFYRHDMFKPLPYLTQQLLIKWLEEAEVVVGNA